MDDLTELLERTSRTFALGIRRLPDSLEHVIGVAYLLLRVSDYFEDNEQMDGPAKIAFLGAWADALSAPSAETPGFQGPDSFDDRTPDAAAARAASSILTAFRALDPAPRAIVGRHVVDSTKGMARWVESGPAFETEADLDDYMFEVAGRVGLLLTELFALRSGEIAGRVEEMSKLGVEFGLGLQTVNVIRGLSSDPERGWVFVPRAFVPEGVDPSSLWREPGSAASIRLIERLVSKAERHLASARHYVLGIPRHEYGIRVFCLLPLLFAVETLRKSRSNPEVYLREIKLSRDEVRRIVRLTSMLAWSNRWVRTTLRD